MISFRDVTRTESTDEKLAYLTSRIAARDAEGLFVEAGELEQAVLDQARPARDGWGPLERCLRALSEAAAGAYLAHRSGRPALALFGRAAEAARALLSNELPLVLQVRVPEGYIHYALDPLGYALASRAYACEAGLERARRAVVLGIRSVGTSLSAIVAAALGASRSATLRPRGEPGARSVRVSGELEALLLGWIAEAGDVLLVDEGPGATGETFHAVARWLRGLGVGAERIVLFPSGRRPPGLASPDRREFFERSRRYAPPDEDGRVEEVCARFGLVEAGDLSAGRWREVLRAGPNAVAVGLHERVKCRARNERGDAFLLRYVGLGRAGAEVELRLRCLASAGIGPQAIGQRDGFQVVRWVEGEPAGGKESLGASFRSALGTYLSRRIWLFCTGNAVAVEPILEMLRENACEALGLKPMGLDVALRRLERLPSREAVIVDGRLQRREWIRTATGYAKVDATEHGDGVRMPGPTDAAWDLAGAAVEFGLDASELDELVAMCARAHPAADPGLAAAADAYRAPYAACQLGEMALSAREVGGTPDESRLRREAERYRRLLRRELCRAGAG